MCHTVFPCVTRCFLVSHFLLASSGLTKSSSSPFLLLLLLLLLLLYAPTPPPPPFRHCVLASQREGVPQEARDSFLVKILKSPL